MLDSIKTELHTETANYEVKYKDLLYHLGDVLYDLVCMESIAINSSVTGKDLAMGELTGYYQVLHAIKEDIKEKL